MGSLRKVLLVLGALGAGLGVAVVAARGDAPIGTATSQDPTGDSGSGPDIATLTATINADQTATFAVTLANRNNVRSDEAVEFFLSAPSGNGYLNIAEFGDGSPPILSTWNGSSWQTEHYVTGNWSGSTFTSTISLSDLQDALHEPVRPVLWVNARSYTGATPGSPLVQADAAPDVSSLAVSTVASAPATTAATTTSAAPPPPTPTAHAGPTGLEPVWNEKIVRLAHARIEWTRLVFTRVPAGGRVSLACTKGCTLSESPRVVNGTATSKRFVHHPFSHGQVFMTKIVERSGAGWWTQTTIVAQPGGQELATKEGCILTDGTSVPLSKC